MLEDIKLEQDGENELKHRLLINGQDFSNCTCRVELKAGYIPYVEVGMKAEVLEYSGKANVKFDFTPETIRNAAMILKDIIQHDSDIYDAFLASVKSVFNEPDAARCGTNEISRRIIERIFG